MDFGIPPNVVPATDTAQLLGLRVAQQVLEDAAGGDISRIDRERVSVILGASGGTEMTNYMARQPAPAGLGAGAARGRSFRT